MHINNTQCKRYEIERITKAIFLNTNWNMDSQILSRSEEYEYHQP